MILPLPSRRGYSAIAVSCIVFAIFFLLSGHETLSGHQHHARMGSFSDVMNRTLGFERIYVLSLPERTDKRDAIAVGASMTGFQIEFVDGVRGDTVVPKAKPKNWEESLGAATLGCWRGHIDIARKMVMENIQTALLFEDDADWDVMFKEQLYEFAKGSQAVQEVKGPQNSPYGDDWDILWLGHCGVSARPKDDQVYYVIPNDPTMEHPSKVYGSQPNRSVPSLQGNNTRLVFRGVGGRCLTGYGLSLRGAQRLIYKESMTRATSIDRGMSGLCSQAKGDFMCVTPWPPLVGTFKDAGDVSKDSDRVPVNGEVRKVAWTRDIVYPVRMNIDRYINNKPTFRAQFPEIGDKIAELPRDAVIPSGHAEWVTKDQYAEMSD